MASPSTKTQGPARQRRRRGDRTCDRIFVHGLDGANSILLALAVTHGVIVAYVGYRIVSADALPMERQGKFVALPARSTELAIRLTARPLKASRAALRRKKPD